jgi:hypothetical protein
VVVEEPGVAEAGAGTSEAVAEARSADPACCRKGSVSGSAAALAAAQVALAGSSGSSRPPHSKEVRGLESARGPGMRSSVEEREPGMTSAERPDTLALVVPAE